MKKIILFCLTVCISLPSFSGQKYMPMEFYTQLFEGGTYVVTIGAKTITYRLADSTTKADMMLASFDSTMVKDVMEVKRVTIIVREEYSNNSKYYYNGKWSHFRETKSSWIVGVQFREHNTWIPLANHQLIRAYLSLRDPNLASNIRKHPNWTGERALWTGIMTLGTTFLLDGAVLFALHPYFVPVYIAGVAVLAVGTIISLTDDQTKSLGKVVSLYNSSKAPSF